MVVAILAAVIIGLITWQISVWTSARHLDDTSTPLQDVKLLELVGRMADAHELPELKVYVQEIPVINGLASADGRMFITRGFMDKYKLGEVTAPELASVIAHELGHVALGHSKRRVLDFSGQNAIRVILMTVIGRFIPFIGPWIANMAVQVLAARLSRQDEFEADAYAAALMTRIGLGVGPQVSLFQKLNRLTGNSTAAQPAWMMSHPKSEDRITQLENLAREWDKPRLR